MRQIFTSMDSAKVGLRRAMLEDAGIATFIRNDNLSQLSNPFIGAFQAALCVVEDADYDEAVAIVGILSHYDARPDWSCPKCKESVPASFDSCWNCGTIRSES